MVLIMPMLAALAACSDPSSLPESSAESDGDADSAAQHDCLCQTCDSVYVPEHCPDSCNGRCVDHCD